MLNGMERTVLEWNGMDMDRNMEMEGNGMDWTGMKWNGNGNGDENGMECNVVE